MSGLFLVMLIYLMIDPTLSSFEEDEEEQQELVEIEDLDKIENGIHLATGFVQGEGLQQVINNCTNCHSSQLVIQNRMTKERWEATIVWMQETQNLWDLGDNHETIVKYLATYYAPEDKGRRENLNNIEWYELED